MQCKELTHRVGITAQCRKNTVAGSDYCIYHGGNSMKKTLVVDQAQQAGKTHEIGHEIMRQAVEGHTQLINGFMKEACAKHNLKPGQKGVVLRQYTHVNGDPLAFAYDLMLDGVVLERFAIGLDIKTIGGEDGDTAGADTGSNGDTGASNTGTA